MEHIPLQINKWDSYNYQQSVLVYQCLKMEAT